MVVQMAKAIGANVITTGGSDEKCGSLQKARRRRGGQLQDADDVDGGGEGVRSQRRERLLGNAARARLRRHWSPMLAERGRIVLMAGRDARPPFPVGPFYVKECCSTRLRDVQSHARRNGSRGEDINRWLAAGKLKPQIDASCRSPKPPPPTACRKKTRCAKAGSLVGKIVLKP